VQAAGETLEAARMVAGDALDVRAGDAQVIELAVVESSELTDRLLVGSPLLQRLADTHLLSPFVYAADVVVFADDEQTNLPHNTHATDAWRGARGFTLA
jgi:hypothetical protein